jgi:hypothetical protein
MVGSVWSHPIGPQRHADPMRTLCPHVPRTRLTRVHSIPEAMGRKPCRQYLQSYKRTNICSNARMTVSGSIAGSNVRLRSGRPTRKEHRHL